MKGNPASVLFIYIYCLFLMGCLPPGGLSNSSCYNRINAWIRYGYTRKVLDLNITGAI